MAQENEKPALNLPPKPIATRIDADGVCRLFDKLRAKWVAATPEEHVRQQFVGYLTDELKFPAAFIANEVGLTLNDTRRRCDTIIYTRTLSPLCIVEYKRPTVEITRKVFDQIARYNSVLGASYLIVSNGLRHYCCHFTGSGYEFLSSIPTYEEMLAFAQKKSPN